MLAAEQNQFIAVISGSILLSHNHNNIPPVIDLPSCIAQSSQNMELRLGRFGGILRSIDSGSWKQTEDANNYTIQNE
jgi:hypothetical protein